jgi:hypothetical protein
MAMRRNVWRGLFVRIEMILSDQCQSFREITNLANKGTSIHLLKTLAGHRSIQTTAAYLYSSPTQLRAVVELV